MYGIFTYNYYKNQPNVGKYAIYWAFGCIYMVAPPGDLPFSILYVIYSI